jgi:16S rRNA U1498 N3-methylase RsmE
MGMLNPNQKQAVSLFQEKNNQEQAELIAKKCNELGITKEQFTQIVTMLNK